VNLDARLKELGLDANAQLRSATPHFKIREVFHSDTAEAKGIYNVPDASKLTIVLFNAERLAENVLEPLRNAFGVCKVSSWYRSEALNATIPGASATSSHMTGEAADVLFNALPGARIQEAFLWFLRPSAPKMDQVILERRGEHTVWLHLGCGSKMRGQLLLSPRGGGYFPFTGNQWQIDELMEGIG